MVNVGVVIIGLILVRVGVTMSFEEGHGLRRGWDRRKDRSDKSRAGRITKGRGKERRWNFNKVVRGFAQVALNGTNRSGHPYNCVRERGYFTRSLPSLIL